MTIERRKQGKDHYVLKAQFPPLNSVDMKLIIEVRYLTAGAWKDTGDEAINLVVGTYVDASDHHSDDLIEPEWILVDFLDYYFNGTPEDVTLLMHEEERPKVKAPNTEAPMLSPAKPKATKKAAKKTVG